MKRISNDFRLPNIEPSPCSFSAQGSLDSKVSRDITWFQDVRGHRDKKERLRTRLIQIKCEGDFKETHQK